MYKYSLLIGIVFVILSFIFYLFGLMRVFPVYFTAIPLFLSILFTVHMWNNRNRFNGKNIKINH